MFRKVLFVFAALIFSLAGTTPVFASSGSQRAGAVYILTNDPAGNQVIAYNRAGDGSLTYAETVNTGGTGSGVGVTVPPDPLGSQNSLLLSDNGRWLFAVNAGSNQVTVFSVKPDGLKRTDLVSSGGDYPVSLTFDGQILYVLNAAGDGSISGFRLSERGTLSPLAGSHVSLNAATPNDGAQPQILKSPAQVGFSPDGRFLIVTDKGGVSGTGRILVFKLHKGVPQGAPTINPTAGPVPFAFTFDRYGHLAVVDAAVGSLTTYSIDSSGSLTVTGTAFTNQAATCWIAFNGHYLFTDNTGSGTISAFQSSKSGSLTDLNPGGVAIDTGAGTLPLDMGIAHNGHFLYSLQTGSGQIGIYQIAPDGSLTSGGTVDGLPIVGGYQGIAVR